MFSFRYTLWNDHHNQTIKNMPAVWETQVWSLGWEDPLEKGMATHSNILAWRISWTEEPDGLQFMGSPRVRDDWSDLARMEGVPKSWAFSMHQEEIKGRNWEQLSVTKDCRLLEAGFCEGTGVITANVHWGSAHGCRLFSTPVTHSFPKRRFLLIPLNLPHLFLSHGCCLAITKTEFLWVQQFHHVC